MDAFRRARVSDFHGAKASKVMPVSSARIFAVIVTYLPDVAPLRDLLDTLLAQTSGIVVVDNTPCEDQRVEKLLGERPNQAVRLIRLGTNKGIAQALNVGVNTAIMAGASHVLLCDQDSLPARDMAPELLRALDSMERQGRNPGAAGPTYTDRYTGLTYPFQAHVPGKFFYGHFRPDDENPIGEVLTLITSGTLIPIAAWKTIGPMREDFFIDLVDIEWSHRARAAGFALFGTSQAKMFHSMGERSMHVWYFGWRKESAYAAPRIYYRVRNFTALCFSKNISTRWKIRSSWYYLGLIYSHVFYGEKRMTALRMAARGLWDGFRGRMGPLQY